MSSFTLATFYDRTADTEIKLYYLNGDAAVRVTRRDEVLHDIKVMGGGENPSALAMVLDLAFVAYPKVSRTGTFYDRRGSCYFDETYTLEHLEVAIRRAEAVG